MAKFEAVKKAGLIKHWGVSNFDVRELEELFKVPNGKKCFANEDLYNVTARGVEYDLLPWQRKHHLLFLGYSPFHAVGWRKLGATPILTKIAHKHKANVYQVMLAWILRQPNLIPLPKASQPDHLLDNVAATNLQLDQADLAAIAKGFPTPTQKVPLQKV